MHIDAMRVHHAQALIPYIEQSPDNIVIAATQDHVPEQGVAIIGVAVPGNLERGKLIVERECFLGCDPPNRHRLSFPKPRGHRWRPLTINI